MASPGGEVERIEFEVFEVWRRGLDPYFRQNRRAARGGLGLGGVEVDHRLKLQGSHRSKARKAWLDVLVDDVGFFLDLDFSLVGFHLLGRIHE